MAPSGGRAGAAAEGSFARVVAGVGLWGLGFQVLGSIGFRV